MESGDIVSLPRETLDAMIQDAAERGARKALASIGLHDENAARDIGELVRLRESGRKPEAGAGADHAFTPLAAMLETMRCAHEDVQAAPPPFKLEGKEWGEHIKTINSMRALILDAAKAAAPYVHARMIAPADAGRTKLTHEEALAEIEALEREGGPAWAALRRAAGLPEMPPGKTYWPTAAQPSAAVPPRTDR